MMLETKIAIFFFLVILLVVWISSIQVFVDPFCEEGYSVVDESCVMDDITPPVINGPISYTLRVTNSFDPLVDVTVTATDDVDATVAVTVKSNNVDVDTVGSYIVVYEAKDASGNAKTHILTVIVI